jgi:hypothetical protein
MIELTKLTTRQKEVIKYLTGKDWTSPTEIGRLFGGHSAIGSPICKKLVEFQIAVRNNKGHYKLAKINQTK